MSNTNTGGPAFPYTEANGANSGDVGMTLRQYAAIKLKVPDSGTDWLDDMIRKSQRDDFAAKAMQGVIASLQEGEDFTDRGCEWAYKVADVMPKAREA
jgi:hypothetical protein